MITKNPDNTCDIINMTIWQKGKSRGLDMITVKISHLYLTSTFTDSIKCIRLAITKLCECYFECIALKLEYEIIWYAGKLWTKSV